ncbi:unnamed protein product [Ectocarpus fasciculatus]
MAKPRSRQRGRHSLENELRELNRLYRWDRMRSPPSPSTSSPRAFGFEAAASNIDSVTKRSRSRRRRRGNLGGTGIDDCIHMHSSGSNDVNVDWSAAWQQQPTSDDTPCLSRPSVDAQGEGAAETEREMLNTNDTASKTSSDLRLPDDRETDGGEAKQQHQVAAQQPLGVVLPAPSPDHLRTSTAFDAAAGPSPASPGLDGLAGDRCSESGEPETSEHLPAAAAVAFVRPLGNGVSDGDRKDAVDARTTSPGLVSARGLPGTAQQQQQQQQRVAVGDATAIAEGDASSSSFSSSSSSSALGDEAVVDVAGGRVATEEEGEKTGGGYCVAPDGDPTTIGEDNPAVSAAPAATDASTTGTDAKHESDDDSSSSESSSSGSDEGIRIGKIGVVLGQQRGQTRASSKRRVIIDDDSDDDDDDGGGNVYPAEPRNVFASEPSSEEMEEEEEEDQGEGGGEGEEDSTSGVTSGPRLAEAADVMGRTAGAPSSMIEKKSRRPGRRRRVLIDEDSNSSDAGCAVSAAATAAAATVSDEDDSPCEATTAPAVDGHGGLHLARPRRRKGERAAGAKLKTERKKPGDESLAQGDVPLEIDERSAGGISAAAVASDGDKFHASVGIVPSGSSDGAGSEQTVSSGGAGDGYRTAVDEDGCSSGDEGSLDAAEEWNIVTRPLAAGGASSVESAACSGGGSGRGGAPRTLSVGGHDEEDNDDDLSDVGRKRGGRVARGGSARRRKVLVESSGSDSSTPGSKGARGGERGSAPRRPVVVSREVDDGENFSGGDAGRGATTAAAAGTRPSRCPRRQARRVISDDDEERSDDSAQGEGVRSASITGRNNVDAKGFSYAAESSSGEEEEEEEDEEDEEDVREHLRTTAGRARREKPTAAAASLAPSQDKSSDDAGEAFRSRRRGATARVGRSAPAVPIGDSSSSCCSSPASSRTAAGGVSSRSDNSTSERDDGHDIDDDDDDDDDWCIGPATRRPNPDHRRKVQEGDSSEGEAGGPSSTEGSPHPSRAAKTPAKSGRPEKPRRAGAAEGGTGGGGAERKAGGTLRKKGRATGGGMAAEGLTGTAFSRARESLTAKYFVEFNEGAFEGSLSDVKVAWSARLSTTAGVTKSLRRVNASGEGYAYLSTVELSTKVLDSEDKLRQTLLHELCHAAAWVVDHKSNPPHGDHFWAWANRAKAAHPGVPITTCHSYAINYKYRYTCVGGSLADGGGGSCDDEAGLSGGRGCGAVIGRHSKSIDVARQASRLIVCGRCKGRLVLFGTHGTDGKLKKPRAATGFSLFVKERYAEVKGALPPGTKQQQVMKEISRQWAARGNIGDAAGGGDSLSSARADRTSKVNAKAEAPGDRGKGAGAVPLRDKENVSFFDLT